MCRPARINLTNVPWWAAVSEARRPARFVPMSKETDGSRRRCDFNSANAERRCRGKSRRCWCRGEAIKMQTQRAVQSLAPRARVIVLVEVGGMREPGRQQCGHDERQRHACEPPHMV